MLHICCAPDATVPLVDLKAEGWKPHGFFYGSNIHPEAEYRRRLDALMRLREKEFFPLRVSSYEPEEWFSAVESFLDEPEGGERCIACFSLQLTAAARCAVELGCSCLCTTLTISPHKDVRRIDSLGQALCLSYGLKWLGRVWRKNDGFLRSLKMTEALGLYRQNYCGCACSMRTEKGR